jgi:hypothetical protein
MPQGRSDKGSDMHGSKRLVRMLGGLLVLMTPCAALQAQPAPPPAGVVLTFLKSSYFLPVRVRCPRQPLRWDLKLNQQPDRSTFTDSINLTCGNTSPITKASSQAQLNATPALQPGKPGSTDGNIMLQLAAAATGSQGANAYAGLYQMEMSGGWGRWRLTNSSNDRAAVIKVSCQVNLNQQSVFSPGTAGFNTDVTADASISLRAKDTDDILVDLCPLPDPSPPISTKLHAAKYVCFGAGAVADLMVSGIAMAKVESSNAKTLESKATTELQFEFSNFVANCDVPPGVVHEAKPAAKPKP